MSVLVETTVGDIVVDLHYGEHKIESYNFLKLCKSQFYQNQCLYDLQKNYSVEFGDALLGYEDRKELRVHNTSIEGILRQEKEFSRGKLIRPTKSSTARKNACKGLLGVLVVHQERNPLPLIGSKSIITLNEGNNDFGDVVFFGKILKECWPILDKINTSITDNSRRPLYDIRIRKMHIIFDPFPDPDTFLVYNVSLPTENVRLPYDVLNKFQGDSAKAEIERDIRRKELSLEVIGDIPTIGIKPSESVLFICKLNPLTRARDIATIFARFGEIISVEIVRDKESGHSLGYGFIEFNDKKSCEVAYKKMDGILIDDKRVRVDFSQSIKKRAQI